MGDGHVVVVVQECINGFLGCSFPFMGEWQLLRMGWLVQSLLLLRPHELFRGRVRGQQNTTEILFFVTAGTGNIPELQMPGRITGYKSHATSISM